MRTVLVAALVDSVDAILHLFMYTGNYRSLYGYIVLPL